MEALQHSFLATTSSLPLQSERQASNRHRCSMQACTPSRAISASLNQQNQRLTGFCRGSNELAYKVPPVAKESSSSRRHGNSHLVIVMRSTAASGYASALVEVGSSHKVLGHIKKDMEVLDKYLDDKQVFDFFNNPTIFDDKKKAVMKSIADAERFSSYTLNLLNLVIDKKRTSILKEIVKEFEELYNEITDTEIAIVTSAIKISTEQLAQIAKKIQSMSGAKNVRMKNVVDESLIAGFMVRYGKDGSRFIDLSVKGQLDRIAAEINLVDQAAFA